MSLSDSNSREVMPTDLNFFQRYSQREDHVTNNTLMMLRHLYRISPAKLEFVLNQLGDDIDLSVGVGFHQQHSSENSRPDGRVFQKGWDLRIETKLGDSWNTDQLERHMTGFQTQGEFSANYLLLLSTDLKAFEENLPEEDGVTFLKTTFSDLLDILEGESVVAPHEIELAEIVDDFRDILAANNLLPNPYLLYAFNCAATKTENLQGKYYYEPANRPTKLHVLNGLYAGKAIRAIGRADCTVEFKPNGEIDEDSVQGRVGSVSDSAKPIDWLRRTGLLGNFDQRMRIYKYEDHFIDMEAAGLTFEKDTKGGYQGGVWLNLAHWFENGNVAPKSVKDIASLLDGQSFGNTRGF